MSLHNGGPDCGGCETKLLTAHPYLIAWFDRVKAKYPNTHVSWAWRSRSEQDELVAQKKSDKPWPTSAHNYSTPSGLLCSKALDLFQIDEDGVGRWSAPFFNQLWLDILDAKEPIVWGGKWREFGDFNHFQLDPAKEALWGASPSWV